MSYRTKTGLALRAIRYAAGLGLRETARHMGITHAYLCDIEFGRRTASEEAISKARRVLGRRAARLLLLDRAADLRNRAAALIVEAERLEADARGPGR